MSTKATKANRFTSRCFSHQHPCSLSLTITHPLICFYTHILTCTHILLTVKVTRTRACSHSVKPIPTRIRTHNYVRTQTRDHCSLTPTLIPAPTLTLILRSFAENWWFTKKKAQKLNIGRQSQSLTPVRHINVSNSFHRRAYDLRSMVCHSLKDRIITIKVGV